jgi:mannose-6-phosphate isomerase-like protein (cupin superfamily)
VHAVVIQRGRGRVLVGETISAVAPFDLVHVPARTWHQFRADDDAPLGFLCLVNHDRDRPELPDGHALAALRATAEIAAFIRDE